MSKGARPRPRQVSREEYERRWAEAFGGQRADVREIRRVAQLWRDGGQDLVRRMLQDAPAVAQADGDPGDCSDWAGCP